MTFKNRLRLVLLGATVASVLSFSGMQGLDDTQAMDDLEDWQVLALSLTALSSFVASTIAIIGMVFLKRWAPSWALGSTLGALLVAVWLPPPVFASGLPYSMLCLGVLCWGAALTMGMSGAYAAASVQQARESAQRGPKWDES